MSEVKDSASADATLPDDASAPTIARLASWFSKATWGLKGVMGGHAYERYVSHLRQEHPEQEPLSEKEFWKEKAKLDEKNVQARCC